MADKERAPAPASTPAAPTAPATASPAPGRSALTDKHDDPVDAALATAGSGAPHESGATLHTDDKAASAASKLNAHAFTAGQDIFFGAGQYQPSSSSGQQLIAHEVSHVQQSRGTTAPKPGAYSVAGSHAAEEVAARGGSEMRPGSAAPATIFRAEIGQQITDQELKRGVKPETAHHDGAVDGLTHNVLDAKAGGATDKDTLQAFRMALQASSARRATAAFAKLTPADKTTLKGEHDTLLRMLEVIGPPSAKMLNEVGAKVSTDKRFGQEILWHGNSTAWMNELDKGGLLNDFLTTDPRRAALDKKSLEHLADYTKKDDPTAKAAFEKGFGDLKSGNYVGGGWTALGQAWDQDHTRRLYLALQRPGFIPPAHLRGLNGVYIGNQYKDATGALQVLNFGYFVSNTIVMPLYAGGGGNTHNMVGAKHSKGPGMEHFQSTMLHEVGHLVGDQTGEHNWGTTAGSPLKMAASSAVEIQTEWWDSTKNVALKGAGADPVSEPDAKLYLEAEARGQAAGAFASSAWGKAAKSPALFQTNLQKQYSHQVLFKQAKAINGQLGNAYTHPHAGNTTKNLMFAYLTRFNNNWAKYEKECHDQKVSWYSMSSAKEWFAEQYQYYMATQGKATIAAVKTKFKAVMKQLDTASGSPAMKSPGANPGGAPAAGDDPDAPSAASHPVPQASSEIHRFEVTW
ncbi:MAG: DUF4157 domain-containing protein [Deltaproteobacteria bacterium]|nr:MAG: DUF4157 domain-containing protein [Deltaproteobacteria bacterium]